MISIQNFFKSGSKLLQNRSCLATAKLPLTNTPQQYISQMQKFIAPFQYSSFQFTQKSYFSSTSAPPQKEEFNSKIITMIREGKFREGE